MFPIAHAQAHSSIAKYQFVSSAFLVSLSSAFTISYRVFSHDVTAAILVTQNNETAAMLVSQTSPVGVELFSYANAFFFPINLRRCWTREWKHSIRLHWSSLLSFLVISARIFLVVKPWTMLCFDSEVDLQKWLESTKDYFKVSNSTLLNQNLTFI